jgi:hypothetical protein
MAGDVVGGRDMKIPSVGVAAPLVLCAYFTYDVESPRCSD